MRFLKKFFPFIAMIFIFFVFKDLIMTVLGIVKSPLQQVADTVSASQYGLSDSEFQLIKTVSEVIRQEATKKFNSNEAAAIKALNRIPNMATFRKLENYYEQLHGITLVSDFTSFCTPGFDWLELNKLKDEFYNYIYE